jgi:uncharacterized membrane protein
MARVLDLTGIILILFFWVYSIYGISGLPEKIPTHFSFSGEPDSFGNRNSAYLLPCVATIIFILLTVVNRKPERFNYPVAITERNTVKQYRLAGNFIRFLRISIVIVFIIIFVFTSNTSVGEGYPYRYFLLPIILLLVLLPVLIYLILASRMES